MYDYINDPGPDDDENHMKKLDLTEEVKEKLNNFNISDKGGKKYKIDSNAKKGVPTDRMIFTRHLGHYEIPRSYLWTETHTCWICDKHTYSVLLASKTIAKHYMIMPKKKDKESYMNKIIGKQYKTNGEMGEAWGSDDDDINFEADNEMEKD